MHKRNYAFAIAFFALASIALTGCGGKDEPSVGPNGTAPKAAPSDLKPAGMTGAPGTKATGGRQAD